MEALVANFIGVALGIVFGALPGLTAVMGVALLIPFDLRLPRRHRLFRPARHVLRRHLRGSITAILVGTPGTAAAAATMLEGPSSPHAGSRSKRWK